MAWEWTVAGDGSTNTKIEGCLFMPVLKDKLDGQGKVIDLTKVQDI